MGYTTDFDGSFQITPAPAQDIVKYINKFSRSRRMKRAGLDPVYGIDGEYFIHDDNTNVVDHNNEPATQPGLWCQWIIEGNKLEWDGGEKFYEYIEWLFYMIENFFAPSGYKLNGKVKWQGEDDEDKGVIQVVDNVLYVVSGTSATTPAKITSATKQKLVKMCFTRGYTEVSFYTKIPNIKQPLDFSFLLRK